MAKNIVTFAKTKDFEPTLNELNRICTERPYLNRSEIMRMAIKFWVTVYKAPPRKRDEVALTLIKNLYDTLHKAT